MPPSRRTRFPGLQDAADRAAGQRRALVAELVGVRLESGQLDARLSTVERYAAALGRAVSWQVRPSEESP